MSVILVSERVCLRIGFSITVSGWLVGPVSFLEVFVMFGDSRSLLLLCRYIPMAVRVEAIARPAVEVRRVISQLA